MIETLEDMQEILGDPIDGEERVIIEGDIGCINYVKNQLETSFEVTIWTHGWTVEQIKNENKLLTANGISNFWDETMNAFFCFKNDKDMWQYYDLIKEKVGMKIWPQSINDIDNKDE
jgi:hypothetical protein